MSNLSLWGIGLYSGGSTKYSVDAGHGKETGAYGEGVGSGRGAVYSPVKRQAS